MITVNEFIYLTGEEHLEGERRSEIRHEPVGRELRAGAGAGERRNLISGNGAPALHSHLKGNPSGVQFDC